MKKNKSILMILAFLVLLALFYVFFLSDFLISDNKVENNQTIKQLEVNQGVDNIAQNNAEPVLDEAYYDVLTAQCEQGPEANIECCLISVNNMKTSLATLAENNQCPEGFDKNILRCPGSLTWCEKKVIASDTLYDDLEAQCKDKSSCCAVSVAEMRKNNYLPAGPTVTCPDGYFINGLECPGSLAWCQKNVIDQ